MLNDQELQFYSRHLLLENIDFAGQEKLKQAHVLVVGLGGVGCAVATYLGLSGIGRLYLLDHDTVDLTNLQRQFIYSLDDLGHFKADVAKKFLQKRNPHVAVHAKAIKFQDDLQLHSQSFDIIVDASDNFETRDALIAYSKKIKKPLVTAAAERIDGQIIVARLDEGQSACPHCLFSNGEFNQTNCRNLGVIAPLVGMIGSMQALLVLSLILKNAPSSSCFYFWDGGLLRFNSATFKPSAHCCAKI